MQKLHTQMHLYQQETFDNGATNHLKFYIMKGGNQQITALELIKPQITK